MDVLDYTLPDAVAALADCLLSLGTSLLVVGGVTWAFLPCMVPVGALYYQVARYDKFRVWVFRV